MTPREGHQKNGGHPEDHVQNPNQQFHSPSPLLCSTYHSLPLSPHHNNGNLDYKLTEKSLTPYLVV
jgi:hypothetical protein